MAYNPLNAIEFNEAQRRQTPQKEIHNYLSCPLNMLAYEINAD